MDRDLEALVLVGTSIRVPVSVTSAMGTGVAPVAGLVPALHKPTSRALRVALVAVGLALLMAITAVPVALGLYLFSGDNNVGTSRRRHRHGSDGH